MRSMPSVMEAAVCRRSGSAIERTAAASSMARVRCRMASRSSCGIATADADGQEALSTLMTMAKKGAEADAETRDEPSHHQ